MPQVPAGCLRALRLPCHPKGPFPWCSTVHWQRTSIVTRKMESITHDEERAESSGADLMPDFWFLPTEMQSLSFVWSETCCKLKKRPSRACVRPCCKRCENRAHVSKLICLASQREAVFGYVRISVRFPLCQISLCHLQWDSRPWNVK